jgi:hypothetical protein
MIKESLHESKGVLTQKCLYHLIPNCLDMLSMTSTLVHLKKIYCSYKDQGTGDIVRRLNTSEYLCNPQEHSSLGFFHLTYPLPHLRDSPAVSGCLQGGTCEHEGMRSEVNPAETQRKDIWAEETRDAKNPEVGGTLGR